MYNVIQCGLGSMGSLMARIALDKKDINLVGAICRRDNLHGTDLSDYLKDPRAKGKKIYPDFASAAKDLKVDLALTATGSFLTEEVPVVERAISEGMNVISIAEEMAYPQANDRKRAAHLEKIARDKGVSILGTGINPGFVLDLLIITLTGICRRIDRIYAERSNDLSPYGGLVMQTQGIGTSLEAFNEGLKKGNVVGHIGFQQSIAMIADAIGFKLDSIQEERQPIIAKKERKGKHITVSPGMVAGCRHTGTGLCNGKALIELIHPQEIQPEAENKNTWDNIKIEGEPSIDLRVEPEMAGGLGTASIAVNMIPLVVDAQPGLKTMKDLPTPRLAALKS